MTSKSPQDHKPGTEFPSKIKLSRPFLTQEHLDRLNLLTQSPDCKIQAFNLIWSISKSLKFPIRTITTAMNLFQRTMLYNPPQRFPIHETVLACLLVSCKMVDTPKKIREIITTAHKLRSNQTGYIPLTSAQIEDIKSSVISYERQILETIGFDFRIRYPHQYIVKMIKTLNITDISVSKVAWVISTDFYMTTSPLKFPAHSIALSSIILSAKLKLIKEIFPIDSDKLMSTRKTINLCLMDILDFYVNYLPTSQLGALSSSPESNLPSISVSTFMNIRQSISRELTKQQQNNEDPNTISYHGLETRDSKQSDIGTVRYILDWEKHHVKGEIIS